MTKHFNTLTARIFSTLESIRHMFPQYEKMVNTLLMEHVEKINHLSYVEVNGYLCTRRGKAFITVNEDDNLLILIRGDEPWAPMEELYAVNKLIQGHTLPTTLHEGIKQLIELQKTDADFYEKYTILEDTISKL